MASCSLLADVPVQQYICTDGEPNCVNLARRNLETNLETKYTSQTEIEEGSEEKNISSTSREEQAKRYQFALLSWTDADHLNQVTILLIFLIQ